MYEEIIITLDCGCGCECDSRMCARLCLFPDPLAVGQNRGILEPILEETDEEEHAAWSLQSYETNASSTSSSSGDSCDSVVQLAEANFLPGILRNNIAEDALEDTVSERDFFCPPKRRKQELFAESFNTPGCLKVNPRIRFESFEYDHHKKR